MNELDLNFELDQCVATYLAAKAQSLASKKKQLWELEDQIRPLMQLREVLEQQIREAESPFKTGDVIEWNYGFNGKVRRGRVVRVTKSMSGAWDVVPILLNGKEGKEIRVRAYKSPKKIE